MGEEIVFSILQKENIFQKDFEKFDSNNKIEFSNNKGIAVIYGPNGVGKSTLSKILNSEKNTQLSVEYKGIPYTSKDNALFHVIADQNNRNIIKGETQEFILGENIKKEIELKKNLNDEFDKVFTDLKDSLKNKFNISKKTSPLIGKISNNKIVKFITVLANRTSKKEDIDIGEFVECIKNIGEIQINNYDENCFDYLIKNINDNNSPCLKIMEIDITKVKRESQFNKIEEDERAIGILERYKNVPDCIVCDTKNINHEELMAKKKSNREIVINALDKYTKEILKKIVETLDSDEPFGIKQKIAEAISTGDSSIIVQLQETFKEYFYILNTKINNLFLNSLTKSNVEIVFKEYNTLMSKKLKIEEEDEEFIRNVISENIGKDVVLKRDENKNIIIYLDNTRILETERNELHLSSGEQNFISLAFELLKAKNSAEPIIVLDDPISSFDSIYKNKIAYCIIKVLNKKKQIILTHNTDLLRLLEVQYNNCFNLYLFNNIKNEQNGFISVNKDEQSILLYMDKLLDLLRGDIDNEIVNERNYVLSLVPFMRALSKIVNQSNRKSQNDSLTKIMHGYGIEKVNITEIYNELFDKKIQTEYWISAQDIISMQIDNIEILKNGKYPLLNKTLKHTLNYLYLRLNVEKTLRDKYPKETANCELLGEFIDKALRGKEKQSIRIKLTSKKTLLNEFNHYEGNMNLFQPAIDISDEALENEKNEILTLLNNM